MRLGFKSNLIDILLQNIFHSINLFDISQGYALVFDNKATHFFFIDLTLQKQFLTVTTANTFSHFDLK